jgi:hypothetical protein
MCYKKKLCSKKKMQKKFFKNSDENLNVQNQRVRYMVENEVDKAFFEMVTIPSFHNTPSPQPSPTSAHQSCPARLINPSDPETTSTDTPAVIHVQPLPSTSSNPTYNRRSSSLPPTEYRFRRRPSAINTNPAACEMLEEIVEEQEKKPVTRPLTAEEVELGYPFISVLDDQSHANWMAMARAKRDRAKKREEDGLVSRLYNWFFED